MESCTVSLRVGSLRVVSSSGFTPPSVVVTHRIPKLVVAMFRQSSFRQTFLRHTLLIAFAACVLSVQTNVHAKTLYVNNRLGSDRHDGLVESAVSGESGPVRTIGRALALAGLSDSIVIAKTKRPYYESLTIMGEKNSGTTTIPFRIVSQGAIVSGAIKVPDTGWKKVGKELWKVTPYRKGTYQLIRSGKALTELRKKKSERWYKVPELPENQWCHWHGSIYYQAEQFGEPNEDDFAVAQASTGATFLKVEHVVVRGVIFQHFRVDGIQLHNSATNIEFDNVGIYENGRAGLTVNGTSSVLLRGCEVLRNRDHSILLKGFGVLAVEETVWDNAPTDDQ